MSVFLPDRVKELKERGGVRVGALRTKGTSLSQPNKTCSSSSNGGNTNREKSSPKFPNHREGLSAPPKLPPGAGGTLCSTPKSSPRAEGRARRERETGIEHLTPVRCHRETLGPDAPSVRPPKARDVLCSTPRGRIEVWGSGIKDRVARQDIGIEHLTRDKCPAEWRDGEERQRSTGRWSDSKDGEKRNPKERSDRRERVDPVHHDRVTRPAGGREQEERLKWYHKQLQQLVPLQSAGHPSESSSTSVSSSSSSPAVSASSSSSPKTSFSPGVHRDLEELLNVYRAAVKTQTGVHSRHPDRGVSTDDDAVGTRGLDPAILTKRQETADEEASYEREVEKSVEAVGAGEGRETDLAVEEGQRRRARVTTTLTEKQDVVTSTQPLSLEASVASSSDPGDHWRTPHVTSSSGLKVGEEYADANWTRGKHGYRDSSRHLNQYRPVHPRRDPAPNLAPAERPLSPACEPTDQHVTCLHLSHLPLESKDNNTKTTSNIVPPLPSPYPQQGVEIISERELGSTDFGVKRENPNSLLSRPQYCPTFDTRRDEVSSGVFNGCREHRALTQSTIGSPPRAVAGTHSVVKACDNSPNESSIGSLSCGMDPLSLSQLEVSLRAASESFLCGKRTTVSPCFLKTEEQEVTIEAPFNNNDDDGGTDLLWENSK